MPSRCLLLSAFAALASLGLAAPAGAANFRVTTTADVEDPAPDGRSLREAVQDARLTGEDDTIEVPPGLYSLTSGDLDLNAGHGKFTIIGTGARATAIDGGDLDRIFTVPVNAVLELSSVTVRNGKVTGASGGGINSDGTVTLTDAVVTGNESTDGAGIASAGPLTLTRSLVSRNVASGRGGGIEATGLSLVNSTVSGNRSNGSGAGIWNHGGSLSVLSSTITGNDGGPSGGRGFDLEGSIAAVANSIISGNPRGDCRAVAGSSIGSQGGNLAGGASCGFGPAVDPLGPLADNGGGTNTHALLTGSPAIDAGGTGLDCPGTDQRGVPRPQGQDCDSGAFEAAPVAVTGPAGDTVAPRITGLKVSNAVFMVRRNGRAAQTKRVPQGTRFRFRLSEAGGVGFTIERRTRGRRVGTRCRAITTRNRGRPPCIRWVAVRRFVRAGVAGRNSTPFSGRITRGRKVRALSAGRFRATIRASDAAGNRSKAARVSFRIVR